MSLVNYHESRNQHRHLLLCTESQDWCVRANACADLLTSAIHGRALCHWVPLWTWLVPFWPIWFGNSTGNEVKFSLHLIQSGHIPTDEVKLGMQTCQNKYPLKAELRKYSLVFSIFSAGKSLVDIEGNSNFSYWASPTELSRLTDKMPQLSVIQAQLFFLIISCFALRKA